ncbi:MAG TPA: CNNM domain-containing protein, partial [Chthoniobacteraceae bacterium]|nr:CNNM domain-containing protein [Chthoniobacteraceae bacterium]
MNLLAFIALMGAVNSDWDGPGTVLLKLLSILLLVCLNGFFVAAEFALVKIRGTQLETLVEEGNKTAQVARHLTSNLEAYLSACQLGITLASLGLGWIGEPFLAAMLEPL